MYSATPNFQGSNDHIRYKKWKNNLEEFFNYFVLISEKKYHYAQITLVGQTYWWWKNSRINDQCWFILQDHLRSLYAPHRFYASKADYNDLNIEQGSEPKPESRSFADIDTELLDEIQKLVASQTARVDVNPKPDIVEEPEPKPEVVDEPDPESKVKDPLIRTHVNLPAEPTMKLSSSAMRVPLSLRSPDVYDHLQIFLKATGSQEVEFPMVQSTIGPVFNIDDLFRHVACVLFEIPSTAASGSQKPVSPPPPWFSHDASVLITWLPPWRD